MVTSFKGVFSSFSSFKEANTNSFSNARIRTREATELASRPELATASVAASADAVKFTFSAKGPEVTNTEVDGEKKVNSYARPRRRPQLQAAEASEIQPGTLQPARPRPLAESEVDLRPTTRAPGAEEEQEYTPGDATGDGIVDEADAKILFSNLFTETDGGREAGDFNQDGVVDGTDFNIFNENKTIGNSGNNDEDYVPGDATGDGLVDEADAKILFSNLFSETKGGREAGDFNQDGVVDGTDFNIFNENKTLGSDSGNQKPAFALSAASIEEA